MIDLHCHILPGVDDGAGDLAAGIAMCRAAAAAGCEAMVATPHQRRGEWWNGDGERLAALAAELRQAVDGELRVLLGGEVHVDDQLLADLERRPESGIQSLAGSRYLLIELPFFGGMASGEAAAELVHELIVGGWRPVLAHPELIPWLAGDRPALARLVGLGAALQVTAMSLTGDFGRRPQQDAQQLVSAGLAHFVASDAHDLSRRPPGLRRAHAAIAERWGEETARRLTVDNPRAVLEDRPLPAAAVAGRQAAAV